ncbi:MAG: hypothetical protein ACOYLQ_19570 [Hyphomicrobiaceae bacterium]
MFGGSSTKTTKVSIHILVDSEGAYVVVDGNGDTAVEDQADESDVRAAPPAIYRLELEVPVPTDVSLAAKIETTPQGQVTLRFK